MIGKKNTYKENERQIIANFKKGDKVAFAKIYDYYFEPLCVYCLSLTRNKTKAEDIVQDVFVTLWNKREGIRTENSLKSFLYRSTYNAFIDQYRKRTKEISLLEEIRLVIIDEVNDNPEVSQEKQLKILKKLIEELPEKRKQVFVLNKLQNYKYREIAEELNISERTVESQIRKALISLKDRALKLRKKHFLFAVLFSYYHF